jgi:DNA-directed RNA polymerase III subunit RPC7
MPAELRPSSKRKNTARPNKAKRLKAVPKEVVEQKLQILEQKELENPDGEEKSVKGDNESDDEIENVSDGCEIIGRILIEIESQEDEEMADQEMDDDGDYENNYFDNGEGFNDEDDNLDDGDGPVY